MTNVFGNTVVVSLYDIDLSKTVLNTNTNLSGTNIAAIAGHTLTYTLNATETGGSDYPSFVFTDDISDILEYSTIVSGSISNSGSVSGDTILWDFLRYFWED